MEEDSSTEEIQGSKDFSNLPSAKNTAQELSLTSECEFVRVNNAIDMVDKLLLKKAVLKGCQDSYQIQEKLGHGGFGNVYRVQPLKSKEIQYAMKIVEYEDNIKMERKILNDAKSLRSIHLPQIYDSGYRKKSILEYPFKIEHYFIVIDLLGPNLNEFGCSYKMWLKIAEQCLIAIEALHYLGYIHRDIKPDNFVLGRKGSNKEYVVIMIDFGLSQLMKRDKGRYRGTSTYGSIAAGESDRQGPKDDLESWFYMLMEPKSKLPWRKEGQEQNCLELKKAIRDDKTDVCKEFFGDFDSKKIKRNDYYMDFAKIMRYIDSLKFDEVPDYNRIHYFLQCAYRNVCVWLEKFYKEEPAKLSKSEGIQAREDFIAKMEQNKKEVANFEKFSHALVEQPANLTFFTSILYEETRKYVKNIEYCGVSYISSGKKPKTKNHLRFKCYSCIDKKPCGLVIFVHYDGTERTWDEARIEKIKGDPSKCRRLKKFNEACKLFIEGMKSNGK